MVIINARLNASSTILWSIAVPGSLMLPMALLKMTFRIIVSQIFIKWIPAFSAVTPISSTTKA